MKVFELAKELGMTGKEFVEKSKAVGIELKGHMAPIDDRTARMLKAMFPPPSPEELERRAAAERAKQAKAKPKAKRKKVAKKKVLKKVVKKKRAKADVKTGAAVEGEVAEEVAEEVPAAEEKDSAGETQKEAAPTVGKKPGKKDKKKPSRAEPEKPLIQFQFVGEADVSADVVSGAEVEVEDPAKAAAPPGAPPIEDIPKTRIEALLADRRWEKLGVQGRVRSARAQASSRFGGRARRGRRSRRLRGAGAGRRQPEIERPSGEIEIIAPITVRKLSEKIGVRLNILMGKLLEHGTPANINDFLPEETAQLVALDFEVDLKVRRERDLEEELAGFLSREVDESDLIPRAPVVTFMGHVDHGKTSLLDRIRQTDVASGEAGGITQHIGAYTVGHGSGFITFIDTPGHEAFTEMRARGAQVTDIAVLVVAADDGVMPQTEEAVSHARAAGVQVVVALNKVDLPNANPERARQQLATLDLSPEEWGGQTGVVECSAETGEGIEALLERIALEAELLELKASPGRTAEGFVLEAEITEGRGIIATVLVRDGTLKKGDVILSSHGYGRARSFRDYKGSPIAEAGPSTPVAVTGLSEIPNAGDRFYVLEDLERAREIAQRRKQAATQAARAAPRHVTLETLTEHLTAGETVELRVVLKADVKGTLEAILPQLAGVGTAEATVNVIHRGVGAVNSSDVLLADASDAVLIGFNVGVDASARRMSEERRVDVRLHRVIYELLEEVRQGLEGKLAPEEREVVTGHAEVRQVFKISRVGTVAGSYILDGTIERTDRTRVMRDGKIVFEGRLDGLRRFKDDIREVRSGFECGIKVQNFEDLHVGDQIEAYRIEEVARTL